MFKRNRYPILEYDTARRAVVNPGPASGGARIPPCLVVCFFREVNRKFCRASDVAVNLNTELRHIPVWSIRYRGRRLAVLHPGVGAPLAAGLLDEAIAHGARNIVACGCCGALTPSLGRGAVVVPTAAVRDEGTSYHYLPAGREVRPHPAAVRALERALRRRRIPFVRGKTWTTDAFYRETPARVARRRAEGCTTVEMEAAAFFSVAKYRGARMAQILYRWDDVSGPAWNYADWKDEGALREELFQTAADASLAMAGRG